MLGWRDFLRTRWISMGFSALFVLVGLIFFWVLVDRGFGLVIYPLLSGFLVVAPILVTGYQRAARLLRQGHQPQFRDLFLGITEGTSGIWFLTFVLCLCYLIWITDALVIYGIYFGIEGTPLNTDLFNEPSLRNQLLAFLLYSSLLGLFIALMGFVVGAFSIPLIMHQRMSFIAAVHRSVVTVFRHFRLMVRWGLTLAVVMLLTLIVAMPLLVVVLPVLAYASYAAYLDLIGES